MFVHPRQYDSAVCRDFKGGGVNGREKGRGAEKRKKRKRKKARAFRQKAL